MIMKNIKDKKGNFKAAREKKDKSPTKKQEPNCYQSSQQHCKQEYDKTVIFKGLK